MLIPRCRSSGLAVPSLEQCARTPAEVTSPPAKLGPQTERTTSSSNGHTAPTIYLPFLRGAASRGPARTYGEVRRPQGPDTHFSRKLKGAGSMRLSTLFDLGSSQSGLDFVDVDPTTDVRVYIDPAAIRLQSGAWAEQCQAQLRTFFGEVLDAVRSGDRPRLDRLFAPLVGPLGEPNETHLGLSTGRSRGRGLSRSQAAALTDALARSKAAKTGLLQDLEDSVLFIPGLGPDILSDMTTCIVGSSLVEYTQGQCAFHDIPMQHQETGPWWDPDKLQWRHSFVELPRAEHDKLLLVPRSIVRAQLITDRDRYYRGFLRPIVVSKEMASHAGLVRILKDGTRKPNLGAIDTKYGGDKETLTETTTSNPQALDAYRASITPEQHPRLDHLAFTDLGVPAGDLEELLEAVEAIAPGRGGANAYHKAVAALLTALWDGKLGNARMEVPIHDGRKRLDIRYDNVAGHGFFRFLSLNRNAAIIPVECKNYASDIANPELDQVAMRLSDHRGRFAIIVSRTFDNKELFLRRCRDVTQDGNGYVVALDDQDLRQMVWHADEKQRRRRDPRDDFPLLRQRFYELVS